MRLFVCLFAFLSVFLITGAANAQELQKCGEAVKAEVTTPDFKYCNIHDRRLGYAKNRLNFREQLDQRRKNYGAPRFEAFRKYKEDLKTMYEEQEKAKSEAKAETKEARLETEN